jgi:hypothetical protein
MSTRQNKTLFCLLMTAWLCPLSHGVNVDIYQYMGNSGNEGESLTSTSMAATTAGGMKDDGSPVKWYGHFGVTSASNGGPYVVNPNPLPVLFSGEHVTLFPEPVVVGGTSYNPANTRTWKINVKPCGEVFACQFGSKNYELGGKTYSDGNTINIQPYISSVTVGCFFSIDPLKHNDGSDMNLDTIVMGGTKVSAVLQVIAKGSNQWWIINHEADHNVPANRIPIEANKTYWINLHFDGINGICRVAVYDPVDWSCLGTKTAPAYSNTSDKTGSVSSFVRFGRKDTNHAYYTPMEEPTYEHFSHIMIDYTEAKFPLIPTGVVIPPDTTPPQISNVRAASVGSSSAVISWQTDEAADSRVDYGPTTSYGSNRTSGAFTTIHSLALSGLTPDTLYYYRVRSKDQFGNESAGPDASFRTLSADSPDPDDPTPGSLDLREAYVVPDPVVDGRDPVIHAELGDVETSEITIYNAAGRMVHSATVAGGGDYVWAGPKASGTYFAVIHGNTAKGKTVKARCRFAVVR